VAARRGPATYPGLDCGTGRIAGISLIGVCLRGSRVIEGALAITGSRRVFCNSIGNRVPAGEERLDDLGVPLLAGAVTQDALQALDRHGLAVRPVRHHGVARVGHGHDASGQRDLVPAQAVGVPGAVETLVVLPAGFGSGAEGHDHGGDETPAGERLHAGRAAGCQNRGARGVRQARALLFEVPRARERIDGEAEPRGGGEEPARAERAARGDTAVRGGAAMGADTPPTGRTPGSRRAVRTIPVPSISWRRMAFGEPTSPLGSGVMVAALRPRPVSRMAVAAA